MEENLFWSIFSAVGTVLGAIATTAAVIVALWQTKQGNKKKLKLQFNEPITISDPITGRIMGHYIGITIVNVGNRDVIISDWSILCSNGKHDNRYKIMTDMQGLSKISLPSRLPIEDSLDLSYERKYFVNLVCTMIKEKEINPEQKIRFQILDSTGKKYFVASKLNASKYANEKEPPMLDE